MTGSMFAIYAIANVVLALWIPEFDAPRLFAVGAVLAAIAAAMLATRPPDHGTPAAHAVVAASYLGSAAAVFAFAPHGSATVITGLFTAPLLSIWMTSRRAVAAHLAAATAVLLAVALASGDHGTLFATLCFLPAQVVLAACCVLVLDALEAQGDEFERLAMRDALTGIGNEHGLDATLDVELARHRSANAPLAVIDLHVVDFAQVNAEIGRAAGDGVLTTVAAALIELAPSGASVARTAGDRFAVVLPATGTAGGGAFAERVRERLRLVDAGSQALAVSAGVAAFPADGTRGGTLRAIAADRVALDPPQRRPYPDHRPSAPAPAAVDDDRPRLERRAPAGTPSPDARDDAWTATRVDRGGFARDPLVWRFTGATFLLYAALAAAGIAFLPETANVGTVGLTASAAVIGLGVLAIRPPAIGTPLNHAITAAAWLVPIGAMVALAPHASWAVGTAVFSGALIACRLTERRHVVAHLLGATTLTWATILSGRIDAASILADLALLLSTWVLVISYTLVFEAAEEQGRRMAELVVRDPLTGAGNPRLLRERLRDELPRHRDMQMPLVVAELDLPGLDALAHHDGRGAVADLLRDVAVLLGHAAGDDATVARIEGDRFRLLLPLTDADDVVGLVRDVRRAIGGTSRRERPILPRIGIAAFPQDGETEEQLIAAASTRMAQDDPRAHDLTTAPDPLDEPLPIRRVVGTPSGTSEHHVERRRSVG
ncbi:MAG: GGDEF domain-containing protein [Patulibacter minatonensis]